MASHLLLHIGDSPTNRYLDGDILYVATTYDALRVTAETICKGRGVVNGERDIAELAALYKTMVGPRVPMARPDDLARWWDRCEALTGLDRDDFADFPFTPHERKLFLPVPLTREATQADRMDWTGKARVTEQDPLPAPKQLNWPTDVLGQVRVRRDRARTRPANEADVRNPRVEIHVLDPVSPLFIRDQL